MHRQHTRNLRTMVFWWRAWSWLLHLWSMASEMSSLRCETVWSLGDGILDLTSNSLIFLKQQPSFGPKRLFLPISSPNWLRTNSTAELCLLQDRLCSPGASTIVELHVSCHNNGFA